MNNVCVGALRSFPLLRLGPCRFFSKGACHVNGAIEILRPPALNTSSLRTVSTSPFSCPYVRDHLPRIKDAPLRSGPGCLTKRQFHGGKLYLKRAPRSPSARLSVPVGRRAPIPFGNLGKSQLETIYQHTVAYEEGNRILQILHTRRVTGSLVDEGVHINAVQHEIPPEALMKALAWLREKFPVDEQAAADAWAEHEAQRLENTYIARAEKLGLYKPLEADARSDRASTKSVYGDNSVLDEFKRFHEQRRTREAKEKKESGEEQKSQELSLAKREERERTQEVRLKTIAERREARALKGMVSTAEEPPTDMTTLQRLSASTGLAAVLIAAFFFLGTSYTPPPQSSRLFPDVPTAVITVSEIVALNVLIYLLWKAPPLWRTLNMYFMQTPASPIPWGVLCNTFSHQKFTHLTANMAGLIFYGINVHEDIGRGNWLALYLTGAVFGSVCSLWGHVLTKNLTVSTNGASGAVWAIMAAWAYLNLGKPSAPTDTWAFSLDVSRWAALVFQLLVHFSPGILSQIDVASHAGGAVVGVAGAWWLVRTAGARRAREEVVVEGRGRSGPGNGGGDGKRGEEGHERDSSG